jgi:hypothetical protein
LFGVQSGNGFKDLAAYDSDPNGWIDENDPIFTSLDIWSKDQLSSLGQKRVGSIYLGNAEAQFAQFDYKNRLNQTLGQNRQAGIFAKEDGTIGTMQQVDLMVQKA